MEPVAALARLHLADCEVAEAVQVTNEAIGVVAAKGCWIWAAGLAPSRAEALVAAGRAGEAAELVAAFARGLRGRDAPAPKAGLALCRAILAEAQGQSVRAATLFGRAAAAWWALPRPYDGLLARERQARCLITAGRPKAGLELLAVTRRELAGLGAGGDADRVARTLREHGVLVPRAAGGGRPGYGDRLSPRELEVVRLVAAGRTNQEVAQALSRSPNTVGTQLTSAMRKLNVSSRTALAARLAGTSLPAADGLHDRAGQSPPGRLARLIHLPTRVDSLVCPIERGAGAGQTAVIGRGGGGAAGDDRIGPHPARAAGAGGRWKPGAVWWSGCPAA
jgi:DNA-binding CsgD family transcriptional regulator